MAPLRKLASVSVKVIESAEVDSIREWIALGAPADPPRQDLQSEILKACNRTDKSVAGLLKDLRARGLFDNVLVLWGGEFGRLPIAQLRAGAAEATAGRDHNKNVCYCWMAGAGVKPGTVHGSTDEIGFMAVEDRVSVTGRHATMLYLLGLDYEKLYDTRNGLNEKLTALEAARIVSEILS